MSAGKNFPSITATGREGVWQLLHYEFCTPLQEVVKGMEDDAKLKPESEDFILLELHSGVNGNCIHVSSLCNICNWTDQQSNIL